MKKTIAAIVADNPGRQIVFGLSEAGDADLARFNIVGQRCTGPGLGHRPALDERKTEAFLERCMQFRIDTGAESEPAMMLAVARVRIGFHQD